MKTKLICDLDIENVVKDFFGEIAANNITDCQYSAYYKVAQVAIDNFAKVLLCTLDYKWNGDSDTYVEYMSDQFTVEFIKNILDGKY